MLLCKEKISHDCYGIIKIVEQRKKFYELQINYMKQYNLKSMA